MIIAVRPTTHRRGSRWKLTTSAAFGDLHAAAQSARTAGGYVDDRAPSGSASPASRASAKSGEMLAFAHIPIGPANKEN